VYVRNTKPHLNKLEDHGKKMVFAGYEKGTKAYKAYDLVSKKVHVTRDVVFDELAQWDWSASSEPFMLHWETDVWTPSEYTDAGIPGEGGALEPDTPQAVHGGRQEEQSPLFN
jgi:hypothetical protein